MLTATIISSLLVGIIIGYYLSKYHATIEVNLGLYDEGWNDCLIEHGSEFTEVYIIRIEEHHLN